MRLPPEDVIATWPEPDFTNPITHGSALAVANGVFMALMLLVIFLRFYSRFRMHAPLCADDILIAIAATLSVSLGAVVINANNHFGWNRHIWDVPKTEYRDTSISTFAAKILFIAAAYCTRMSLMCFYLRLVGASLLKYKWVLRISLASQIVICIALVLLQVFLCIPVHEYWNTSRGADPKCLDEGAVNMTSAIINTICELWTTLLPFPIIMGLNMPLRQRLQVVGLLSIGFIVTIVGVVRIYYVWQAFKHTYDMTWYSYQLWTCGVVEVDLAVFCASAPALKNFLQPIIRRILGPNADPFTTQCNVTTTGSNNHCDAIPAYTSRPSTKVQRSNSLASSRKAILDKAQQVVSTTEDRTWCWKSDPFADGNIQAIELQSGLNDMKDIDTVVTNDENMEKQRQQREKQPLPSLPPRADSAVVGNTTTTRPDSTAAARRPSGIEVETTFNITYSPPLSPSPTHKR